MYRSDQFDFRQLSTGVFAAIALPGSGASSNCGIVDIGRSCLVFDTSMTPRSARDLRAAARLLTDKEPLDVVNSHWHLGHVLGNRIFGGCTIRSTALTRELIARHGAGIAAAVNASDWSRSAGLVERRRDEESRPLYRDELMVEAAARRDLGESRDAVDVRIPDEVFSGRYTYPGRRDVMLVEGAGHSESDTALFVPDEEAMFTGDLLVAECHPDLLSADIDRWLGALERIEKAAPRTLVPGHGPPVTIAACAELAQYLRDLRELARSNGRVPIPEPYLRWQRPSLFEQNLSALRRASEGSR